MIHDLDGSGPLSDLRNERKIAKWTIVREDGIKIWSFKFGQDDGASREKENDQWRGNHLRFS